MARKTHRWVIDSIQEHVATIEVDEGSVLRLPDFVLPAGAAEGQVLTVVLEAAPNGQRSVITIEIDAAASADALALSKAQVNEIKRASSAKDSSGNVTL